MKKEVLLVLLNDFADWEGAFIAPALNQGIEPGRPTNYSVKTLSVTKDPVVSIGGMKVIPDYDIHTVPEDYAGLILIGGMTWFTPEAQLLVPLVQDAVNTKKLVAGICNGSVFLAINGFLNDVKHTSNTVEFIKSCGPDKYTGDENYLNKQAVRDGNIITANGSGYLEFCREILYALDADTREKIEESYFFNKNGYCPV
ncbi:MAG: glutamine amidotransferase [Bacteroides sp.]|nr:glutamine amidotransferase [Bacteroides sp.]